MPHSPTKPSAAPLAWPGRIGLGTWKMGEERAAEAREVAAVRHALEVGYRIVDTAEMYADGGAERVVGRALKAFGAARRPELVLVSKVLPENASRHGTIRACEASIRRMGCEYLDLYLLHWRGQHPFTATLEGFGELLRRGLIRHFGVSNLDVEELGEWLRAEQEVGLGATVRCNQVYYCVASRDIEFDLLPWQRRRAISTMAYSPLQCGDLANQRALAAIGRGRGVTASQVALAWCVRDADVIAIPKSIRPARIEENLAAAGLRLSADELRQIDATFPPPRTKRPLAMV
jgi:diketogulonate reductase-like aldo/keto reductase